MYVEDLAVKTLSPIVLCSKETGEVSIELANMNDLRENDMVHISILDNILNGIELCKTKGWGCKELPLLGFQGPHKSR